MPPRRVRLHIAVLPLVALVSSGCSPDAPGPVGPDSDSDSVAPSDLPRIEGSWRRGPDLPRGVFRPEVAYHGGLIYLVGGATEFYGSYHDSTNELWVLDPAEGVWRPGPTYPVDGTRIALMAREDTLYGVGGERSPGVRWDRLFRLPPGANRWERLPFEAGPTGRLSTVPVEGGFLALDETGSGELWRFRLDDLRWTPSAPMPWPRADPVLVAVGGAVYAVYGQTPGAVTVSGSFIDRYSPTGDTWTRVAPTYASRRDPGVAVLGARIHTVGGTTARPEATADHLVYEPAADTWYRGPDLPATHRGLFGIEVDGELWFMGGGAGLGPLSLEVWIFTPS